MVNVEEEPPKSSTSLGVRFGLVWRYSFILPAHIIMHVSGIFKYIRKFLYYSWTIKSVFFDRNKEIEICSGI